MDKEQLVREIKSLIKQAWLESEETSVLNFVYGTDELLYTIKKEAMADLFEEREETEKEI